MQDKTEMPGRPTSNLPDRFEETSSTQYTVPLAMGASAMVIPHYYLNRHGKSLRIVRTSEGEAWALRHVPAG